MNIKTGYVISGVLLSAIASCANQAVTSGNQTQSGNFEATTEKLAPERLPVAMPTPGATVQINKDPKTLTLAFYEYYIDGFPSVEDERVVFAKYLTPRFLGEALKADDYDPFLDAQDFDETWTKDSVRVSNPLIRGNKATVDVSLKGGAFTWVLTVSLVKNGETWKIDGVKNKKS